VGGIGGERGGVDREGWAWERGVAGRVSMWDQFLCPALCVACGHVEGGGRAAGATGRRTLKSQYLLGFMQVSPQKPCGTSTE